MLKQLMSVAMLLSITSPLYAIDCYVTVMKGTCWKKYAVTFNLSDSAKGTALTAPIVLSGDTYYKRVPFKCYPAQPLKFTASFKPGIWKKSGSKVFKAKRLWFLPQKVKKGIAAWNVPICFTTSFSNAPFPPSATDSCNCAEVEKMVPKLKPTS